MSDLLHFRSKGLKRNFIFPYFCFPYQLLFFILTNCRTGESRGFAFVRYKYADEAQKAVDRLDGMFVLYLQFMLVVNFVTESTKAVLYCIL